MAVMTSVAIAAGIGGLTKVVGAQVAKNAAKKEMEKQDQKANDAKLALEELEKNRQEVINPYENMANEFENLGVATQASKFQAEEADIALANTLDLLASTGASAGGATALAQAALQSKRGIAASLESQEAKNQELIARGEERLQDKQMSEAQRVQNAQMTEAQRMQQADVLGKEFVYGEKERRETEQLNRKQAQITGAAQQEMAARQSQAQIIGAGIGAVGNIASAGIGTMK